MSETAADATTAAERAAIEAVLGGDAERTAAGEATRGRVARRTASAARRSLLLPVLRALERQTGGVRPAAVREVSDRLGVSEAEIYAVASFYALLDTADGARVKVHLCDDVTCRVRGAEAVWQAWQAAYGPGGAGPGGAQLQRSPCLGQCDRAPAALIAASGEAAWERTLGAVSVPALAAALGAGAVASVAPPPAVTGHATAVAGTAPRAVLGRVGAHDPKSLDSYRAAGGYTALRTALAAGRDGVIRMVTASGLQGRGGAAFPTGVKWRAVASQPDGPHYVVANGDESEPGTFKDRVLMEEDPFAVVEGLTIAGFALGAEHGYIYVRGEYPLAAARLEAAAALARARGLLGADILGRGVAFDIELRRGAGAYICGEETALLNSIEGYAGEPRNKPPFPATQGLFGRPTAVNNIETLLQVVAIVAGGVERFRALGTEEAPGTRLYALSGSILRPGVYEMPFGATLGELIEAGGGLESGRTLKAVLLGGAAGSFVGPDAVGLRLTPSAVGAVGASLGSGAVIAFDDRVDLPDIVVRIARFFRDESCGQCVPCRIGTVRQEEMVARLAAGRPLGSLADEQARFTDLAAAMRDASICGLGQTAPAAIESALRLGVLAQGGR